MLIAVRNFLLNSLSPRRAPLNIANNNKSSMRSDDALKVIDKIKHCMDELMQAGNYSDHNQFDYASLKSAPSYAIARKHSSRLYYFDPLTLETHEMQLAFWINLYNLLVLDGVISYGVKNSIMENPLGFTFFHKIAYTINGLRMSAEDIEHGILRKNRGNPYLPGKQFRDDDPRSKWIVKDFDPRIHFALNCASHSCPPIRLYSPEKIDSQLDQAAENFINAETNIDFENKVVNTSKIFQWYRHDFGGKFGILNLISKYIQQVETKKWLLTDQSKISLNFKKYDWKLNGQTTIEQIGDGPRIDF